MSVELQLPTKSFTEEPLNYEQFGAQPEYIRVNKELINHAICQLPKELMSVNAVDVATGTGLIPKLLIESLERTGRKGNIIGIDPNQTSLEIARRTIRSSNNVSVEFIPGFGQMLKTILNGKEPKDGFDIVSIHDAIHEVESREDKEAIIHSMAGILKKGGLLTYNSAFTTKALEGVAMDWGKWKLVALSVLKGKRNKTVTPIEVLKPEEYREMIEKAGLEVIHEEFKPVILSKAALAAISRYPKFIEGAFADMVDTAKVTVEEKSKALIATLDTLNVQGMQRVWHEIIAQKPALA